MIADHVTSPQLPSSSSSSPFCSTIFRVRRKRTADPHGALVISLKRAKQMPVITEPIICFRASTNNLKLDFGSITQSQHFNIIDVDPHQETPDAIKLSLSNIDNIAENNTSEINFSSGSPLELLKNSVEEPSSSSKIIGETTIKSSEITLNGEPLVMLSNQDDEVRLANADDLLCDGEDTESSAGEDEDDDSNDENNWRNDYPDESDATYHEITEALEHRIFHTSGCGSDEDTASDGFNDYEDLERQIGEMGFYDEDSEDDI